MSFSRAVLLSVDVQSYGERQDLQQDRLQHEMNEILAAAAQASGIEDVAWHSQPSGDGEFSVITEAGAEARLLDAYLPEVHRKLLQRAALRPGDQLKLRLALHYGMMRPAPLGYSGAGPVEVARLLNSEPLKRLTGQPGVLAAIAVSAGVYHDIVEGGHIGLSPRDFAEVEVVEKELRTLAYLHAPIMTGAQVSELLTPLQAKKRQSSGRKSKPTVHNRLTDVHIERAIFGPSGDVE